MVILVLEIARVLLLRVMTVGVTKVACAYSKDQRTEQCQTTLATAIQLVVSFRDFLKCCR